MLKNHPHNIYLPLGKSIGRLCAILLAALLAGCSTTSSLGEGEVLYTGMKPTVYRDYEGGDHFIETQAEVDGALACAPNGALFGSSTYRTPLPYGLWIWNAFSGGKSGAAKWVTKTFGKAPVILADVNPELRVSVAETVLQNHGYFRGGIDYTTVYGSKKTTHHDSVPRPRTARLAYTVRMGPLFTLDSIAYVGFSPDEERIIHAQPPVIRRGEPFSIANLDAERTRIYNCLRDSGYYYFRPTYITYQADTLRTPGRVALRLCLIDSLPGEARQRWRVGHTTIHVRRTALETTPNVYDGRRISVEYAGKKPPLRPRVLLSDMKLRPGQMFCQQAYEESLSRLASKGIFSSADIAMKPSGDSLLMTVNATLDKPYDFTLSANYTQKTSGRGGPGVGLGFAKRNAFRGGELLSFNLSGAADFALGKTSGGTATNYDVTADVSLQLPRLLLPHWIVRRRRWYIPPTTLTRLAFETINRTGFFRRNIVSAEWQYAFQPSPRIRHTFTPLSVDYSYLASIKDSYNSLLEESPYMRIASQDLFIPKMRYSLTFTPHPDRKDGMVLTLSATEAGNIVNLGNTVCGGRWNEKDKKMFHTAYSQFVKIEADWRKAWMTDPYSQVVAHAFAGYIRPFGNSDYSPFSERYFMGGANDLRGFSTRAVGPGSQHYDDKDMMYLASNADFKLMCNIEYRPRLFGSLYGALFADAGNVWQLGGSSTPETRLTLGSLAGDIAVSAGLGIRYDLDFFVIRLDWGFIVHAPYDTGHSGYFNTPSFKNAQCINFAIGYPF